MGFDFLGVGDLLAGLFPFLEFARDAGRLGLFLGDADLGDFRPPDALRGDGLPLEAGGFDEAGVPKLGVVGKKSLPSGLGLDDREPERLGEDFVREDDEDERKLPNFGVVGKKSSPPTELVLEDRELERFGEDLVLEENDDDRGLSDFGVAGKKSSGRPGPELNRERELDLESGETLVLVPDDRGPGVIG